MTAAEILDPTLDAAHRYTANGLRVWVWVGRTKVED